MRKKFSIMRLWDKSIEIKPGDKITISGYKRKKNGKIIANCIPGEETVFIAKEASE